jgi:hypothetical protein
MCNVLTLTKGGGQWCKIQIRRVTHKVILESGQNCEWFRSKLIRLAVD